MRIATDAGRATLQLFPPDGMIFPPRTIGALLVPAGRAGVQEAMPDVEKRLFATKREARAFARGVRRAWSPEVIQTLSASITRNLQATHCWQNADTILTYVGALPGELDTRPLIAAALKEGRRVFVPRTRPAGVMHWSPVARLDALVRTERGLLEPPGDAMERESPPAGLCIVPGMLFRADGHRIGLGGGYYDRFLRRHAGPAAGLCPSACFGHDFPVEAHDSPVAWIVTEGGAYPAAP